MRIGLVAGPWVPVPPPAYGGSEAVIDCLARGLQARGHDVRLFTVGESTCPVDRGWWYESAVAGMGATLPEAAHVLAAYEDLADREVIHDHTTLGPVFVAQRARSGTVLVATNHGPFTPETRRVYAAMPDSVALVAISRHHRATAPELPATVIYHGVDLECYSPGAGDGGYLLFVGRMSADKGPERAIRIARAAGRPLVLVAKSRDPMEQEHLEKVVKPLLGPDVTVVGEVALAERVELFRHAEALVNPICWPEPFGLVMPEALACGTPVLAFPNGAAPEIVDDGRTGFLRFDEDGLVRAARRLGEIDRRDCRREVERRFSMQRMVADYEALYARLLRRAALRSGPAARSAAVAAGRARSRVRLSRCPGSANTSAGVVVTVHARGPDHSNPLG